MANCNNKSNDENDDGKHRSKPTLNRLKRPSSKKVYGKIAGILVLILVSITLMVAIRGKHNEMMYMALTLTFFAIALFSYGYWSAVNRGDGIWQYVGSNNLQHQQLSHRKYHFNQLYSDNNFRLWPTNKTYLVTPPKMGGAKLEIITPGSDIELEEAGLDHHRHPPASPPDHHHHHHHHRYPNHHHSHGHHHHHSHHHHHLRRNDPDELTAIDVDDLEPVKCEVQLPPTPPIFPKSLPQPKAIMIRQTSETRNGSEDADFTEVILPDRNNF